MIRYFIVLIYLFSTVIFSEEKPREDLILSTPDQIATLKNEASYLIGGLISPLSGQPVLRQTDLVVKGAQNIALSRTYLPPYAFCWFPIFKKEKYQDEYNKMYLHTYLLHNYKGWQFYPHIRLELDPLQMQVRLSEPSGMTLDFNLSGPNYSITTLDSLAYAINNTAGDSPSGKYDPRNTRIVYEDNGNKITVHATDGSVRLYYKKEYFKKNTYGYLLGKEILPNGKVLKYHYNQYSQLNKIESLDPQERHIYASLHIARDSHCHFTSSSGQTADYLYEQRPVHWKYKEGRRDEEGTGHYPPILTIVSSPFYRHETLGYSDRFLLNSYSGKDISFLPQYTGFGEGEAQHYRTHKLLLPVGPNDAMATVYELSYQPPVAGQREGATTVKNSDGTSTVYHFSKNLLTTAIQYFGQDGDLKKEKIFSWDERNWLTSLEIREGHKNILHRKSYEYDRFGNPIVEVFTGNLTGESEQETYTIKRVFSEDGRNLLLQEENEDGKVVCFSYLPGTDLITSKLTNEGNKILLREFSVYDDCHNLIQTLSDNGSGEERNDLSNVTQRTSTTYTLRQSAPFLHMPEWREETYWEAGAEKSLKKSHLLYDQHGNVTQEDVYDAEGRYAYTISKTYNECGDVLTETNPMGQQAVYTYDGKGRLETSLSFSHRKNTTFYHDTKGRLCERTEKGDDGVVHDISLEYDFQDRMIHKRDPFQNSTRYTYDPLVNKVIETDFPSIASLDGQALAVTTFASYDLLGRELTKTDANGNITTYHYNAYGSPIKIAHPNGGREQFRYAKNGKLLSHTDADGLTIHYTRDVLGRVLSKTYSSLDGGILAEEFFTYNGFNLLTETDKEGNTRHYAYDGAGRKVREEFCGQATDFSYDSLGWLDTVCKHNGDNTLFIHYTRDLEGKILEEHKTDASGQVLYKLSYSYDSDGNQKTTTRYINGKEAIDTFAYDSFHRLVQHQDAEGHVSTTSYNEAFNNALNQRVLQTTILDPRHIATIKTEDALARTVRSETLDSHSATISCREMTYDPQGNLSYRQDHIYEKDRFQSTQTVKYTYTADHRIESLTRGFGTQDARITTYTYSPSGKMVSKTLPDGVILVYSYHPLGFLSRLDSSDGKIRHAFDYNRLGHLVYCTDENQRITIERQVDPFGNVIQEVFPYGPEVKKQYDSFNRLLSLEMKNQGKVLYTYDPLFLRGVTRISSDGKTLYTHIYEEYDYDGHLMAESLIGNLGRIVHLTDPKGQKASIYSPYFSQECRYDSVGNLISNVIDGQEHYYSYDGLSQLSSENSKDQSFIYDYDSLYNRTHKNGKSSEINGLNELLSIDSIHCAYDLNGNQVLKKTASETSHFVYDPLNRLIEVTSENQKVTFVYDPLGRRLSKAVHTPTAYSWKRTQSEHYLYHGQNEIGAFRSNHELKNLRVLGLSKHKNNPSIIGIELQDQFFAPIVDVQGNIRYLIGIDTKAVVNYDFTAFGEESQKSSQSPFNPWRFASKRFDPELGLIYFGKRYYDPEFARWLTVDPAGFVDSTNLYQYVFNNPFRYRDPDGQFAFAIPLLMWGAEIVIPALSAYVPYLVGGAITGAVGYAGLKAVQALNAKEDYYSHETAYRMYCMKMEAARIEEEKKKSEEEQLSLEDAQKKGPPRSNVDQNKQADDAKKEIERELGRKLSQDEKREFHDHITGQGYNYHELIEEGYWLFYER